MKAENIVIQTKSSNEKVELIIREVSKVNELDVKAPVKLNLNGVLNCVSEFLSKRLDELDQINQKRCHILVNREKITIELIFNEHDEYLKGTVKGQLSIHPKFEEFGINTSKVWTPSQLGLFVKMNRSFFVDRETNMTLVTQLMNFTGNVNSQIEKSVKESGDRTDNFSQVVNSNLPKSFVLNIPIFKGYPSETLEVETFAQVSGREVAFVLQSPSANEVIEEIRDNAINEQLELIKEICPNIVIIEQ